MPRGVYDHCKTRKDIVGRFSMNHKKYHVGTFNDAYSAAKAVQDMKQKLNFGGFIL